MARSGDERFHVARRRVPAEGVSGALEWRAAIGVAVRRRERTEILSSAAREYTAKDAGRLAPFAPGSRGMNRRRKGNWVRSRRSTGTELPVADGWTLDDGAKSLQCGGRLRATMQSPITRRKRPGIFLALENDREEAGIDDSFNEQVSHSSSFSGQFCERQTTKSGGLEFEISSGALCHWK